jgi:hypothetical protein
MSPHEVTAKSSYGSGIVVWLRGGMNGTAFGDKGVWVGGGVRWAVRGNGGERGANGVACGDNEKRDRKYGDCGVLMLLKVGELCG